MMMTLTKLRTSAQAGCALILAATFLTTGHAADQSEFNTTRNKSAYDNSAGTYYTGKAPFFRRDRNATATAKQAAPVEAAAVKSAESPKPAPTAKAKGPAQNCSSISSGLIHMTKTTPAEATMGQPYMYELTPTATDCAGDVVVSDQIPAGASYVRSEPAATVDGQNMTWNLGNMESGATQPIKVWLRPDKEGTLSSCASVTAKPRACGSVVVGIPALALTKTGPANAMVGSEVTYNLVVRNTGSSVARDVVVTDTVPEGFIHSTKYPKLTYKIGDLAPEESKAIAVKLQAMKRGKICNTAVAVASNVKEVGAEACTVLMEAGLALSKKGDEAQYINKTANYVIEVANTGDTTLKDITVTDTAPAPTTVVQASGASVNGRTSTWKIGELLPGKKQTFNISLTSPAAGAHCNGASATTLAGLKVSDQACTTWRGLSALLLEVVDDPDPIQINETTQYTIRVTNQGSAEDTEITVVATFPKEVVPVNAPGGSISGQTVKWPMVARLDSKKDFQYTVQARGQAVGDARILVELNSRDLQSSVTEQESTRVY